MIPTGDRPGWGRATSAGRTPGHPHTCRRLTAGLGNPGPDYRDTRHNVGFRVADRLAGAFGLSWRPSPFDAEWASGFCDGIPVILAKPMTFMNRSGGPLGAIAALKRDSGFDVAIRVAAVFGQSMPSFWVAMLLMMFFAVRLQILPVSGLGVKNAILPMATLAFFQIAVLLRLFRSEMLEIMHQDYVRTARAKGLKERGVVIRHAFKNAALPVLTMAGLLLAGLILGAVVVEPIFAWPGLGHLMVNSVFARDYPVVVGGTIVAAVLVTLVNLAVDILYGFLDPRIRVQ